MDIIKSKLNSLLTDCSSYFSEEVEEASKQPAARQIEPNQNQAKALPKSQQRVKHALKVVKTSGQQQVAKKKKPAYSALVKKAMKPMHRPKTFKVNNVREKKSSAAFNIDFSPTRKAHDYKVFEKVNLEIVFFSL